MRSKAAPTLSLRTLVDPLNQEGAGGVLRVDPLGNVHYDGVESSDSDGGDGGTGDSGKLTSSSVNAVAGGGTLGRNRSFKRQKQRQAAAASGRGTATGVDGAGSGLSSVADRTKNLMLDADGGVLPNSLNPTRPVSIVHNTVTLDFEAFPYKRPNSIPKDRSEAGRYAPPALTHATSVGFESEDVLVLFGGCVGSRTSQKPLNDTWTYNVVDKQWTRLDVLQIVPEALVKARKLRGFSGEALPPPRSGHCAVGIRDVELCAAYSAVSTTQKGSSTSPSTLDLATGGGGGGSIFGNNNNSSINMSNNNNNNTTNTSSSTVLNITSKKDLFTPVLNDTLGTSVLFELHPSQQILLAAKKSSALVAKSNANGTPMLQSYSRKDAMSSASSNNQARLITSGMSNNGNAPFSGMSNSAPSTDQDPWSYRPSMIVFGGADISMGIYYNDLWLFDVQCLAWRQIVAGGQQPTPRWKASAAAVEQRVFIFGGETSSYTIANDLHMYDHLSGMWRSLRVVEPCPRPRMSHSVSVVGDKIIIVGGVDKASYAERAAALSTIGGGGGGRVVNKSQGHVTEPSFVAPSVGSDPLDVSRSTRASTTAFAFTPANHNISAAAQNGRSNSIAHSHQPNHSRPVVPLSDVWCLDSRTLLWREIGVLDKRNSVFALHQLEEKVAGGNGKEELTTNNTAPPDASTSPSNTNMSSSRLLGGRHGPSRSSSPSPRGFFASGGGSGHTMQGAPFVVGYGSLEGHVSLAFNQHIIVHGGLLNGKLNTKVFSFDVANETWQFHGDINTTGGFSAGNDCPTVPTAQTPVGGGAALPPTKPQPRAYHCGATFVHNTCPHSLRQFGTIGKMREGQIHLSELKETEPLLDFFALTRAQQVAESGVLSVYKNRPVTQRTICIFIFGGQSSPRNMSDLWMLRLREKAPLRSTTTIGMLVKQVASAQSNASVSSPQLLASGIARAELVPVIGMPGASPSRNNNNNVFLTSIGSQIGSPTSPSTSLQQSSYPMANRQALADVLYAASKAGVIQTDPTVTLPKLLRMNQNSSQQQGPTGGGSAVDGSSRRDVKVVTATSSKEEGTYARSQRYPQPEGYFQVISDCVDPEFSNYGSQTSLKSNTAASNKAVPRPRNHATTSLKSSAAKGENLTVDLVAVPVAQHSSDSDSDYDDEAEEASLDVERRQRVEARKQRLVEQLRGEIINAAHQYLLGGAKATVKKRSAASQLK